MVAANPYATYDLHEYYTKNISYELDDAKRKGLAKFLELIGTLNPVVAGK